MKLLTWSISAKIRYARRRKRLLIPFFLNLANSPNSENMTRASRRSNRTSRIGL